MTETTTTIHNFNLFRRYFELVAAGTKTIEVRVRSPKYQNVKAGDTIRFHIKGTDEVCEVKALRVTDYDSFEALLDGEGPANVNPTSTREEQLGNIRSIYGPEKESYGPFAIEMKLIS